MLLRCSGETVYFLEDRKSADKVVHLLIPACNLYVWGNASGLWMNPSVVTLVVRLDRYTVTDESDEGKSSIPFYSVTFAMVFAPFSAPRISKCKYWSHWLSSFLRSYYVRPPHRFRLQIVAVFTFFISSSLPLLSITKEKPCCCVGDVAAVGVVIIIALHSVFSVFCLYSS